MLDLYTHATPNGYKISIALEELGLPYAVHTVNMREGEQFTPEILAMNPNAKIPILKDGETGMTVYESNAILLYLADKTGQLFPSRESGAAYWEGVELLFFQAASVGPMFGQRFHFAFLAPETVPYGIRRYDAEGARLHGVMNALLAGRDYFLGDTYSIVDITHFGWVHAAAMSGEDLDSHPNLKAWLDRVAARPAVKKGLTVPMARDASQMPPRKQAA